MNDEKLINRLTSDKLGVTDTLHRFAAGIDLENRSLLASAFADDAISDFRPAAAKAGFDYPVLTGRDTIVAALSNSLSEIDTKHSVSNPRVSVDGDTAHLDALVEAQHVPRVAHWRHYLMKNRYDVDLVRRGDIWVIQRSHLQGRALQRPRAADGRVRLPAVVFRGAGAPQLDCPRQSRCRCERPLDARSGRD